MSIHGAQFDKCQRERDNATPPEYDDNECPLCGDAVMCDGEGYQCVNKECDWSIYPDDVDVDPGYDGILGEG